MRCGTPETCPAPSVNSGVVFGPEGLLSFTRTHAVTLGYLGAVQARQGDLEEACATWSHALDAMEGVRSGRTRQVAADMQAVLAPFRRRGGRAVAEIDMRAGIYLASFS